MLFATESSVSVLIHNPMNLFSLNFKKFERTEEVFNAFALFLCHIKSEFANNKSVTQTRSVDLCFAQTTEQKPLPTEIQDFEPVYFNLFL